MIVKENKTTSCVVYTAVNGIIKKQQQQSFQPASHQKYGQAVAITFPKVPAGGRSLTTWLKQQLKYCIKDCNGKHLSNPHLPAHLVHTDVETRRYQRCN